MLGLLQLPFARFSDIAFAMSNTYYRPVHPSPYHYWSPPPPRRQSNYAKIIAFAAIGVLAVVALVVLAVAGVRTHQSGPTTATPSAMPTTVIQPLDPPKWYDAVCLPGTFRISSHYPLPNAEY